MAVDLASNPINEILDFLLTQPTPQQVIALRVSDSAISNSIILSRASKSGRV